MKRGVLLAAACGSAAAALTGAALVASVGPPGASASSHREAPLIADDPAADNTDVYAFVSPDRPDTVTIIANYYPFQGIRRAAELLPLRPDRPVRAEGGLDGDAVEDVYLLPVLHHRRQREHVLLQHRPGHGRTTRT